MLISRARAAASKFLSVQPVYALVKRGTRLPSFRLSPLEATRLEELPRLESWHGLGSIADAPVFWTAVCTLP